MPRIAGITTQKDSKGNLTHVTINLKKHGEKLKPMLEQLGVIKKSQFDIDFENGMTVDEVFDNLKEHVKKTWAHKS